MALTMALDGWCRGHRCDDCRTCRSGRCCRRDNPAYRVPRVGDWDGPIYGAIGARTLVGDQMQCHACGHFFRGVGKHAGPAHGLYAFEYRAIFGIPRKQGLCGEATSAAHARNARGKHLAGMTLLPENNAAARLTAEQRAEFSARGREKGRAVATLSFDPAAWVPRGEALRLLGRRRDIPGWVRRRRVPFGSANVYSRHDLERYGRYMACSEAARVLGMSVSGVWFHQRRGSLGSARFGGRTLVARADVERLAALRSAGEARGEPQSSESEV